MLITAFQSFIPEMFLNKYRPLNLGVITGCPRSGTTALLRWLQDHKEIAGFNESYILASAHGFWGNVVQYKKLSTDKELLARMLRNLIRQYYGSKKKFGTRLVIDKFPLGPLTFGYDHEQYENFIKNISGLFPQMRIVFMIRHPLPTVWSMKHRKWGSSLTIQEERELSLEDCIKVWKINANLLAEYRDTSQVYICKFENLVNHSQKESQKVEDFLGLKCERPFLAKPTKDIQFEEQQRKRILEETQRERHIFGYE